MRNGFRQSMAWLHSWGGLFAGWILFAVFLTGTVSYYRQEISAWMRPELHQGVPRAEAAERAVEYLQRVAPQARTWLIELPDARTRALRAGWSLRDGPGGFTLVTLDAAGDTVPVRETPGGDLFYYFHFDLLVVPFRLGRWLVSLCALFMLVAIISGVIVHRRIFADFFTLRASKAGPRAWLDGHNLSGVLALPYHLMITYTGLVTFALMLMPWGADLAYGGNRAAFQAEMFGQMLPGPKTGQDATLAALPPLLEQAGRHWGGGLPGRITVFNPNDAASRVLVARGDTDRIATTRQAMLFDGHTGALLAARDAEGAVERVWGTMYGLHLGRFASPSLRALFFLSGLAGTAMVATGLVLWTAKRRGRAPDRLARVAEVLNIASIAGLPVAMLALLWANRLLPVGLPQRALWEFRSFFGAWVLCLLLAALLPRRLGWRSLFAAAGLLAAGLPVLNALTTDAHLAVTLRQGDWALAGIDLTVLACAPAFAALAWAAGRRRPAPAVAARAG
ncbi:PepSY domain-containing protein [Rhodovastum atsumiense]|uniref:PepSY domain-containing protein n=1 Tax=Rhodovastum atsumiense TaxID=504468 RepID=A0A5M6ILN5_9PROT|nr:PepSY-associated TM helix domain-containing protein [Rhodovastum atsumiense]KAA5609092.1 PepSY domain-containing protein [Rhodovastum atsumiense]CAH2602154.1 PepSY domain-containing protein [Rhodovastum atsumiense]